MAADLLDKFGTSISQMTLIPSSGGVYEVMKNDQMLFSKKELNRFPELDELISLIESLSYLFIIIYFCCVYTCANARYYPFK